MSTEKTTPLQYREVKLIFEIISALILLPIVNDGSGFYITLFILLIDKVVDAFFDTDDSVFIFYMIWRFINQWYGTVVCAVTFCMLYPGFSKMMNVYLGIDRVNMVLLAGVFSYVLCDSAEIFYLNLRSKQLKEVLVHQRKELEN